MKALDNFSRAYLLAAFWTSDDEAPSGEYSERGRFDILLPKLSPEALASIQTDCAKFQGENGAAWRILGMTDEQAGHDFWLTRNHHGSGFWDHSSDFNEAGLRALTDAAHKFGESDLYLGDDGLYYV